MTTAELTSKLRDKLASLPASDRRALAILTMFLLAAFAWWSVQATFEYRQAAIDRLQQNRNTSFQLKRHWHMLIKARDTQASESVQPDQSLLTTASSSARNFAIEFKRFEPDGEDQLKLWLEDVNFNKLLEWLHELETGKHIIASQVSIEKSNRAGLVDARLTLQQ